MYLHYESNEQKIFIIHLQQKYQHSSSNSTSIQSVRQMCAVLTIACTSKKEECRPGRDKIIIHVSQFTHEKLLGIY